MIREGYEPAATRIDLDGSKREEPAGRVL